MAIEIERKFLPRGEGWRDVATSRVDLRDGLLLDWRGRKVRVRLSGDRAWLAYKGRRRGIARFEIEREVHRSIGSLLILLSRNAVAKTRHFVPHDAWVWHVDEFRGALSGVVLADIELNDQRENPSFPDWIGREVTGRPEDKKARLLANAPRFAT